jgi:DNA-directed RNA polymerase subunit M/transcription elongation factor TFIIS
MGSEYSAIRNSIRNSCGMKFLVSGGPSKISQVLHCDRCGKEHWISLIDHGLSYDDEKKVEQLAGVCKCGGKFKVNAFVRCPRCKSTEGEEILRRERSVMINWPSRGDISSLERHLPALKLLMTRFEFSGKHPAFFD